MDVGSAMSRSLLWLNSCDFKSQVVEEVLPLVVLVLFVWRVTAEYFSWNGKAFTKDQIGWRCAYIRF